MKTKHFFICLFAIGMASCQDEISLNPSEPTLLKESKSEFVFPNGPDFRPRSRSGISFETNWENCNEIVMDNGMKITTPWAPQSTGNLNEDANDIKKEDGWEMVMHTFNSVQGYLDPLYYMIFHNLKTGMLKVFYYHSNNVVPTNNALWQVKIEGTNQALLNNTGSMALPYTYRDFTDREWFCSIAGGSKAGTIESGWNFFSMPLTYDPNLDSNRYISIHNYASEQAYLFLKGKIDGDITGEIFTTTSAGNSGPFAKAGASLTKFAGSKAETYINSLTNKKSEFIKLLGQGAAALAKSGIGKIFSSILGKSSSITSYSSEVILSAQLTGTYNGTLTKTLTTGIQNLRFNMNSATTGVTFGAWNLEENPTVYIHPVGVIKRLSSGGINIDEHEYMFTLTGKYLVKPVFNHRLKEHMIKYWTECQMVYYSTYYDKFLPQPDAPISDFGTIGTSAFKSIFSEGCSDYIGAYNDSLRIGYSDLKYSTTYHQIWSKHGRSQHSTGQYKYIYAPTNNDLKRGGDFALTTDKLFVKLSMYMITEFEGKRDTTIEMRTYAPKIEWDPRMVQRYESSSMRDLQQDAAYDNTLKKIDNKVLESL